MSYQDVIPVVAGADLNGVAGTGAQYKAVAIGGTIASNNDNAIGLLQNKPKSGEDASVAYQGRIKYVAGAAITAGNQVRVTTSGYMIAVLSGYLPVGRALETVGSGGIAEGIFNFSGAKFTVGSA